ncbi:MAG: hypothetical protein SOX83_05450 [Sodaliphilus sp.]|nr:hypothetical protein [Sodaliphilus sp.]
MAKTRFRLYPHLSAHERASALTSPPPDFLFSSIPLKPPSHHPTQATIPLSHPSHHSSIPTQPHQIKQPLSKIAVNERAVTALQDNASERIRK